MWGHLEVELELVSVHLVDVPTPAIPPTQRQYKEERSQAGETVSEERATQLESNDAVMEVPRAVVLCSPLWCL